MVQIPLAIETDFAFIALVCTPDSAYQCKTYGDGRPASALATWLGSVGLAGDQVPGKYFSHPNEQGFPSTNTRIKLILVLAVVRRSSFS